VSKPTEVDAMPDAAGKCVVIAGASGFVGSAAAREFAAAGWRVIGLSRRPPAQAFNGVEHTSVDLRDPAACQRVTATLAETTHLIYAAVNETPGDLVSSWLDPTHAARNGLMFENLFTALLESARHLQHVTLVHGTKAYAVHRADRPAPVPLRETLPRPDHDDFYFRQEDCVWSRARSASWHWTVFRAPMIAGGGRGSNLNALLAIAVFAVLRKEAGLRLPFPGAGANLGVMEMVDVDLLARAVAWSAQAPTARDQIFNIANGDAYVWPDLWPVIAGEIGLPVGEPQPMSVRSYIDERAGAWSRIVGRHGLRVPEDPAAFLGESASLADFALGNCARTVLTSTIKIRQAGFHDCIDTAHSVVKWIRRWREAGMLPPR
jgi:nucleoside-diphosphate-sugar epimerase